MVDFLPTEDRVIVWEIGDVNAGTNDVFLIFQRVSILE